MHAAVVLEVGVLLLGEERILGKRQTASGACACYTHGCEATSSDFSAAAVLRNPELSKLGR